MSRYTPLTDGEQITSGILLAAFTILAIFFIIGLWPSELPEDGTSFYRFCLFHIEPFPDGATGCKIALETLLMLLVALGGFLGNMIYIAAAFTAYVGGGRFRKSWVLWYFVKPFTAAGLALSLYLVFRAGLLSANNPGANINPFGIVGLAMLTGMFTDATTKKLRDVFASVKTKEPEKKPATAAAEEAAVSDAPEFTAITPEENITKGQDTKITITGNNFDKQALLIVLGDQRITGMTISPKEITFTVNIPAAVASDAIVLAITDQTGKTLYAKKFQLQ
jgi:hypothetical protein